MKIKVICIGKTGKGFLEEGETTYLNRLKHYVPIERIEIPDLKNAKSLTVDQIKKQEGDLILSKVNSGEQLLSLIHI
jgi:23S rRNA (pseudouridine1915-N3)-methyltransferase